MSNSNIAEQGLLGCGGHGCLGLFERHKYEVVGSNNRSILHLGASELKVISMIYAPPYLMRRRNRRCSRSQARIVSESIRGSTQEVNTGKGNRRASIYYYEEITSKQHQEGNTRQRSTVSHPSSRAVTNMLIRVFVTHDDTAHLGWFKLFRYTT